MKNRKAVIALALGLLAGVLHFGYVSRIKRNAEGGEKIEVLVTQRKVAAGTKLNPKSLATRFVPASYVDHGVLRGNEVKEVMDLPTAVDLEPGQMVEWSDFVKRPDPLEHDLARFVESGQRAMTIPVDGTLSMGGMLKPGHRVDILGTFARSGQRQNRVTVTLLQNVLVLATGKALGASREDNVARFSTATLSVGLEEAELLSLAAIEGSVSLVLRGRQDLSVVQDVPEKTMTDIWVAERRNAIKANAENRISSMAIERLKAR